MMSRFFKSLLCALSLMLVLAACQSEPAAQSEPLAPVIEFVRTSIQVQSDNSYAIWEFTADNSKMRLTTYSAQGLFQYRVDYHYDAQGRITVEQTVGLNEDGSTRTHTQTYDYSGADVVIAVSDFGYEGAACGFTMTDPAHRVNIKDIGVTNGKVTEMTIEELDKDGVWVTEQRIILDK